MTEETFATRRLARRRAAERRFRFYGMAAVGAALALLALILGGIAADGVSAFRQAEIRLPVTFEAAAVDAGDYGILVKRALKELFPEVRGRKAKRALYALASQGAARELRRMAAEDPGLKGATREVWLPASDDLDMFVKGRTSGRIKADQATWIAALADDGRLEQRFNTRFFTAGDSREPELAGILGATLGSLLTLAITFAVAFPLGVGAAVYLEEFAPRNRLTDLIEVSINNLAAVPSIVFGLLGLAVFLNLGGLPRSAPLVGGLVLALMTLPTVVIAGRVALGAVPGSIREAALGLGASRLRAVAHHVLPLAMPGVLTGAIIGMARALGETAPLLMIGMVAFVVDIPTGPSDPATALPVQIFLWADAPERAFVERAAAAILVLLAFLAAMNFAAVVLRRRWERRF